MFCYYSRQRTDSRVLVRYYLGSCEYKWTHAHSQMEMLWIRRELGDDMFKDIETQEWKWTLLHSNSTTLPGDMYCRCDIYVELPESKQATLFALKYSNIKKVEQV